MRRCHATFVASCTVKTLFHALCNLDETMTIKRDKPATGEMPHKQDARDEVMALSLTRTTLSDPMEAYFAKCSEKIGFVPNVLEAYSHDDAKLTAFVAFYNDLMLGPSGLSKLEREMIAVVVSSANRCYYCLTAHGAAVRQLSGDPLLGEILVMNWRSAGLSIRHTAMLEFADKITLAPQLIVEEDRQDLRSAGFSERDIWDIGAVAAFYNMSNRLASATDMRPNRAYHGMAR